MDDFPLLRGINTTDRAKIYEYLQPKGYIFQKGEVIKFKSNQVGFVIKGTIRISRSDDDGHYCIAEILSEGDMFSSVYSMFMKDGLYEVETSTPCRVLLVD